MAGRKIVVYIPGLAEKYTAKIREEAEKKGFRTVIPENREDAVREAAEAEVLFANDCSLCRYAPGLKWVCTPFAGVEPFLEPGIYNEIVRQRSWARGLHVDSIRGSRITLLGTGDIGRECAKRMRSFDPASMTGVNRGGGNPEGLFDRTVTVDRLEEVLPETDLLILSLPATAETKNILDAARLALLPETARLVNVGRGSAVDQQALEKMLREGKLAGAALDVFVQEPIPADDSLWDCPGLLITPHIAGNMTLDYTVEQIVNQFLENLRNYAEGLSLRRLVDRKRAY